MISVERSFPVQIYVSDAQYVYKSVPKDTLPSFDEGKAFFSVLEKEGEYFGISPQKLQFNRFSSAHLNYSDLIFERRLLRD